MNTETESWRMLGILGGMGPAATSDILAKIIKLTPARRDQDHIPILVRCVPQIPDRTNALLGLGPSPEDALARGAASLRRAGAEVLVIACNTAHHWYDQVRIAFDGPVVHIAEAVVDELKPRGHGQTIGLMATQGAVASGFHCRALEQAGFVVLTPSGDSQRSEVNRAIALTKAGELDRARVHARTAADDLFARGASRIVLACTELPLALDASATDAFLDANLALAHACVRAAAPSALTVPSPSSLVPSVRIKARLRT